MNYRKRLLLLGFAVGLFLYTMVMLFEAITPDTVVP